MVQGAAFAAAIALAELPVASVPAGGRNPGGEEVGAEGQNEIRVIDVEIGEDVLSVDVFDGGTVDVVVVGLELQVLDAGGLGEPAGQHPEMPAGRLGDHGGVGAAVLDLAGQGVHPLGLPGDSVVETRAPVAAALHGTGNAIGVVQRLDPGLASRAGLSLVGGVVGVALDLLGPALHDANQNALAGRAVAAKAGVPVVLAPHQVFGKAYRALYVELTLADAEALAGHGPDGRETSPSQEMSPSQFH